MARPSRRKRRDQQTDRRLLAASWSRAHKLNPYGFPRYKPKSPDLVFARRAVGMALTNVRTQRIIDIGGGRGFITSGMNRPKASVTLVDFAEAVPLRQHMRVESVIAAGERLPREWTGKFGVALFAYSLSYMGKEKAIAEAKRVLEKGGRAVALLHHPQSFYMKSLRFSGMRLNAMLALLKKLRNNKIKSYESFCQQFLQAVRRAETQTKEKALNDFQRMEGKILDLVKTYFEGIEDAAPQEKEAWGRLLDENIDNLTSQKATFRPLLERPDAMFRNQAAVRDFFESQGFRIRYLKILESEFGDYGTYPVCYAVYMEKSEKA